MTTPRHFVTQLLHALSPSSTTTPPTETPTPTTTTTSLATVPDATKKQLLSLHVLFPHEFVPALDLLDRRLATRLCVLAEQQGQEQEQQQQQQEQQSSPTFYHVRSAQHHPPLPAQSSSSSSSSFNTHHPSYQVRLSAFHCSCPAFAFAAYPASATTTTPTSPAANPTWLFGGATLGHAMPPVCKHLLACVLAERCPALFAACVDEREIAVEEVAGWAAGWAD